MAGIGYAMHAAALALENLLQEGCPNQIEEPVGALMVRLYNSYEDYLDADAIEGSLHVPGGQTHRL